MLMNAWMSLKYCNHHNYYYGSSPKTRLRGTTGSTGTCVLSSDFKFRMADGGKVRQKALKCTFAHFKHTEEFDGAIIFPNNLIIMKNEIRIAIN